MKFNEYYKELSLFIVLSLYIMMIMYVGVCFTMVNVILVGSWGLIILGTFWYFQTIKLIFTGQLQ